VSHTHRYILHFLLPAVLIVAVVLALFRVHVPWYVFCVIIPGLLLVALLLIGFIARAYYLTRERQGTEEATPPRQR
jgi:hypothetical protein